MKDSSVFQLYFNRLFILHFTAAQTAQENLIFILFFVLPLNLS